MNIGLTQRIFYHKGRAYDGLEHGWYSFLRGHTLFTIANNTKQNFKDIAKNLDLLIITGGNDPDIRRITETKLSTEMMLLGKSIIGICHGAFLLTNLLGGIVEECEHHMDTEHLVFVDDKSQIVNSFHNYQITKVHKSAEVIATDIDNNCEAWIDKNIAGIVWHPERMKEPYLPEKIKHIMDLNNV